MNSQGRQVSSAEIIGIILLVVAFLFGLGGIWYWAIFDNKAGEVVFAGLLSAMALGVAGAILIDS